MFALYKDKAHVISPTRHSSKLNEIFDAAAITARPPFNHVTHPQRIQAEM